MKKMLTVLAVTAIPAMFGGCTACCPTTGLCPCCPCNWFNRGTACPPTYAAPVAAAPVCPPAVTPMPQYVAPMAAPIAAAAPCAAPCATWNPCQNAVAQPQMFTQPQAAPCCQQQPMFTQAQPAYYSEPSCGYAEASCGAPFPGMVSYGPEMPVEYGSCDSGCCGSGGGCCDGGSMSPPSPEAFVEPRPAAE